MATPVTRLSHADLTALTSILKELYSQMSLETLPARMISLIEQMVSCEVITYDEWSIGDDGHAAAYRLVQNPVSDQVTAAMPVLAAYLHEHPLFPALQKQVSTPAKISDFITKRQFMECSVYREVYRRFPVHHQMAFFMPEGGNARVCFVLSRRNRDFSERDRQMLVHVSPHLRQAYTNVTALEGMRECRRALQTEEREIVQLNADGLPQFLSSRATGWLKKYFSDCTPFCRWPAALRHWVRRQNPSGEGELRIGHPLVIETEWTRLTVTLFRSSQGTSTMLLAESQCKLFAQVSQAFSLTEREREIFRWICEAKTNPEIAAIVGANLRTIHKHVERLFAKLGVENRLQAQRLGWELRRM